MVARARVPFSVPNDPCRLPTAASDSYVVMAEIASSILKVQRE